jgi:pimeloyl-ACP methyl ester carboxylesterase
MFGAIPSARAASRAVPDDVARATARFVVGRVAGDLPELHQEQDAVTFDVGKVLDAASALGSYRSRRWIGKIDTPAAVLVHLRDQLVPPHRQIALAHAMPRAVVYPVDGDHFAAVKQPTTFVATLVRAVHDVNRRGDDSQPVEARAAS